MIPTYRLRFASPVFTRGWSARPDAGFTLIELMITVAIVALLASIAYPAYTDSIFKGRRAEARTALTDLLQQQERYLTQTGSYMSFAAGATGASGTTQGATSVNIPFRTVSGEAGGNGAYNLAAEVCPVVAGEPALGLNACVRLRAVPVRADPEVDVLRLWSTGGRDCTGTTATTPTPKCWR